MKTLRNSRSQNQDLNPLSPFQYFKMLFTDEMIQPVAHHTNLYSAQELRDPIKTSPEEIEDFLSMLLFMGVFKFPSLEDYWHHESHFSVISCQGRYSRFYTVMFISMTISSAVRIQIDFTKAILSLRCLASSVSSYKQCG